MTGPKCPAFPTPSNLKQGLEGVCKSQEVDIIAPVEGRLVPFEVKYRSQATGAGDLKGLEQFCADRKVDRGYVITKDISDFSIMPLVRAAASARVAKIPAPLACYWLGLLEVAAADKQ